MWLVSFHLHFFGQTYLFIWWILPHNFTFSPNCPWEAQNEMVCSFHHPSNHSSLVTLKCPFKQDHSPPKGFCSTSSSVWWCCVYAYALRIVMAKTTCHWVLLRSPGSSFHLAFLFTSCPNDFFLLTDIHTSLPLFLDGVWNPICIMTFKMFFPQFSTV